MQSPRIVPQTPNRSNIRSLPTTPDEAPSPNKKARTSGNSTNVSLALTSIAPSPSVTTLPATPTRQSRRISSQTPTSNKRLRKT